MTSSSESIEWGLEVGSAVVAVGLFLGTLVGLGRQPAGGESLLLAVIVLGAALVVLWTVLVPLAHRGG